MAIGTDLRNMIQGPGYPHNTVRDNNVPSPAKNLIADENFRKLASPICDDLAELGYIRPVDLFEEGQFMRAVPFELRNEWCKIREGGEYEIMLFT